MIQRIYIDNFRCFSNFELRPDRINLLLGVNGSGKSSFVNALDRIIALVVDGRDVAELFHEDDLSRWDSRAEQRFELDLEIDGETFTYRATLERRPSGSGLALRTERVTCGRRILFRYQDGDVFLHRDEGSALTQFPFRDNRSFLAGLEERPEMTELTRFLTRLRSLRSYKLEPTRMGSVTEEEQQGLRKDGANFASWYRHLSQERTGDLSRLFERLAEALPGFRVLKLPGAGKQGRTRDLLVEMRADDQKSYDVDFDAISDGQRALIVLYALLVDIRSNRQVVFLDEPENYVGLSELRPWLDLLDDALGDTGQLFFISHHPEVIDVLAPENPILFERPGGGPVRVKRASFDRESGLRASEQIARGLLDGE